MWRLQLGGDASRAVADGGQRLLAAVQVGRVVGSLLGAVVVVRLPALALPFPTATEDPDEGLKAQGNCGSIIFVKVLFPCILVNRDKQ